ncbi:hypothetical protein JW964_04905 [candidate division KSB1 bacterium]|nr:hypothetical protein [candidate division KSB1 bacterium]
MKRKQSIVIVLLVLLTVSSQASVPQLINYQGKLSNSSGNPLSGNYAITFRIYDAATGGTLKWQEIQNVTVTNGLFSVLLGSVNTIPLNLFESTGNYLSLQVANDPQMTPRIRLVSVGYSFRSYDSDKVDGKDAAAFTQKVDDVTPNASGNIDLVAGSNIQITPNAANNSITIAATTGGGGDNLGNHTATQNIKLNNKWISNDGGDEGIRIMNDGSVNVPYLYSGTGQGWGSPGRIIAEDDIEAKDDIWAYDDIIASDRVQGKSASFIGNGFEAFLCSQSQAVVARKTSGGEGRLGGDNGVLGEHSSGNYGTLGSSHGAEGFHSGGNWGYLGGDDGVYGKHKNGPYGALGRSWIGVYGNNSNSSQYAGYFDGNLKCTGTLYKGGGAFQIDHPLDPANKYLNHSFVESPDMKNIYDGVVTLDANGEAVVILPEWFDALNKDFRYQLTCVGGYAPVYIAEKISNHQFKIAGGTSGLEISWQVTGIRKDAWANANRIKVEEDKIGEEAGKYLHPEVHGVPESMGVHYKMKLIAEEEERITQEMRKKNAEEKRIINLEIEEMKKARQENQE